MRRVVLREAARRDIDEAISFYLGEGAPQAALDFVEALQGIVELVSAQSEMGSARYAHELALPGLRSCPIKRFPYLLLYFPREDMVDVWRALHGGRDIPAWPRE